MQGKFRFSLNGADATARQFAEVRRELQELPARVGNNVGRLGDRVSAVEDGFSSLTGESGKGGSGKDGAVVVPVHGGTGVVNAWSNPLSSGPAKPVYCRSDGRFGVDGSVRGSVVNVVDADEFIPVGALRRLRWRVFTYQDDLKLRFDDAQPVVGLLAEDLDDAGLGFFCEYDGDGVPSGIDYPRLSVAALRLAQEAMDEVDGLKATVGKLSSEIDRMKETYMKNPTVGE